MTSATRALLVALLLFTAATSAQAHGEGEIMRPVFVIAALCGGIGGIVTGVMGRSQAVGLGVSLAVLSLIALLFVVYGVISDVVNLHVHGFASVIEEFGAGLLVTGFFVGFAGLIPLAIGFLVTYRLTEYIRRRRLGDAKGDSTAP